jgi:hypothetical protein
MSQFETLSENDDQKIADLLVGRRIVAAEQGSFKLGLNRWDDEAEGKLTLDDGTVVYVVPHIGGCSCGAGDYSLTSLAKVDNVITSVRLAAEEGPREWDEGPTSYRIYVVADAVEINAVQIDGDDGNGYYGTGYELIVVPA